ncbi:hypothetical protein [Nostoc sp.]|uniref:hypothetical protein n=1 Tax=Nostoc sp. TaxID=1180 RepID=UPI002FFB49FD
MPEGVYLVERVPIQNGITNSDTLPNLEVAVNKELVYNQNLQLPIATAAKETEEKNETPEK